MPKFKFHHNLKKKPGESAEDYEARMWKEEAEAREAVMTFVLGLVAEPLSPQVQNQPKGDRLDVIKGKKVLDKFNCAGCHTIQPGQYEFELNKNSLSELADAFKKQVQDQQEDFDFPNHIDWAGKTPKANQTKLKAFGLPQTYANKALFKDGKYGLLLTEALRFEDAKGAMFDIRAGGKLMLPLQSLLFPGKEKLLAIETKLNQWNNSVKERMKYQETEGSESFKKEVLAELKAKEANAKTQYVETISSFQGHSLYGGTFSNLLTDYILDGVALKIFPEEYAEKQTDLTTEKEVRVPKGVAIAAGPPYLIGQGGKTQPEWLYQFLLNPHPIRKTVILRMPHFNLSAEEAKAIVDYFGAMERLTNPKSESTGATFVKIPQQTSQLDDPYWKKKTEAYIKKLKDTPATGGKKTEYEQRLDELNPVWKKMQEASDAELSKAQKQLESIQKELKDQTKPDPILQEAEKVWKNEVDRLKELVKNADPKKQQAQWEESTAYVADAFRMLASEQLCSKCHQIGDRPVAGGPQDPQGPPLAMASKRLKPGWVNHWVANPLRILHYSPMPKYFSQNKSAYQELFVGTPAEQLQALTDVLMIYDQALELPLNRNWTLLPVAPGKKK
jgi:mono/diheme cytochrome c family protein